MNRPWRVGLEVAIFIGGLTLYVGAVGIQTQGLLKLPAAEIGLLLAGVGFSALVVEALAPTIASRIPLRPCPDTAPNPTALDPFRHFGVARSQIAERHRPASELPPYVEREVDAEIARAVVNEPFVLLVGESCTGKSRAGYETIVRHLPNHPVFIPATHADLNRLLGDVAARRCQLPGRSRSVTVWLDDIDELTKLPGLDVATVHGLVAAWPQVRVIATIRTSEYIRLTQGASGRGEASSRWAGGRSSEGAAPNTATGVGRDASRLLALATRIDIPSEWRATDVDRAALSYPTEVFEPEIGLPAHLIGATQLAERFRYGDAANAASVTVVLAATDARRMGLVRHLSEGELKALCQSYAAPARAADLTDDGFRAALEWACAPVPAGVALVERATDGYRAHDYALDLRVGARPGGVVGAVPAAAFEGALEIASPKDAIGIIMGATYAWRTEIVSQALQRVLESDDPAIVLSGHFAFGTAMALAGVHNLAKAAFETVISHFGDSEDEEVGQHVAWSRLNVATAQLYLGEVDEAVATFGDVVVRYGDSTEFALRDVVARALVDRGYCLGVLRRTDEEVVDYTEVITRYGTAEELEIIDTVALARVNLASTHADARNWAAALRVLDEGIEQDSPHDQMRPQDALLLYERGGILERAGDVDAAIAVYDLVIARYSASYSPRLLVAVARAMFRKSLILRERGDRDEEMRTYTDLEARFAASLDPNVREEIAKALINKGATFADGGDAEAALGVWSSVVERFGPDQYPAVRALVARALVNQASVRAQMGASEVAVATWDELIAGFQDDPSPDVQREVANGLADAGDHDLEVGSLEGAVNRYNEYLRRFRPGTLPDSDLREGRVRFRLSTAHLLLEQYDRVIEIVTAFEDRYRDATAPELLKWTALALGAMATAQVELGRYRDAIATFDRVLQFEGVAEPEFLAAVTKSRAALEADSDSDQADDGGHE